MKLITVLTTLLLSLAPLAHADFAGCYAIGGGLFSSQTFSSCYECKGSGLYCQEVCSTVQYTCTSLSSSGSVAPWMNGSATDASQGRAAADATLDCLGKAGGLGATCEQATCVANAVEQTPHACR